jgi:hypothetical protein
MWHLVLAAAAALTVYGLFVFAFPDEPCQCGGRCDRCKGTGRRFRRGARLVRAVLLFIVMSRKPWRW